MQQIFGRISPTRYIVMRNGSRWDPAPGDGDIVIARAWDAKIQLRGPLLPSGWNHQITNLDTGETITSRKDDCVPRRISCGADGGAGPSWVGAGGFGVTLGGRALTTPDRRG
ncbi:MAG: hypothetical protein P1P84_19950 [Deferrisomatales bacterium]|nr:hypothetical protein [Deferrisomatales bacterium]